MTAGRRRIFFALAARNLAESGDFPPSDDGPHFPEEVLHNAEENAL
jgi:hypothetical protein